MEGPRRRWRFGPGGVEEVAPPPASPEEAPSFDSARIEREAEAHFTPGPEREEEPAPKEVPCRESAFLPPEESDTDIQ